MGMRQLHQRSDRGSLARESCWCENPLSHPAPRPRRPILMASIADPPQRAKRKSDAADVSTGGVTVANLFGRRLSARYG